MAASLSLGRQGEKMIAYSIIMFAIALLMIVLGMLVYGGKTDLIHDYHQRRVTDKRGYAKAMGKALAAVSIPLIVSGAAALFTSSILPVAILVAGLAISLIPLSKTQKKYNGGMF